MAGPVAYDFDTPKRTETQVVTADGWELNLKCRMLRSARVMLVSVSYALKAADSNALGGKPAAEYVTQDTLARMVSSPSVTQAASNATPRCGGYNRIRNTRNRTIRPRYYNYLPLWTNSTTLGSFFSPVITSALAQRRRLLALRL